AVERFDETLSQLLPHQHRPRNEDVGRILAAQIRVELVGEVLIIVDELYVHLVSTGIFKLDHVTRHAGAVRVLVTTEEPDPSHVASSQLIRPTGLQSRQMLKPFNESQSRPRPRTEATKFAAKEENLRCATRTLAPCAFECDNPVKKAMAYRTTKSEEPIEVHRPDSRRGEVVSLEVRRTFHRR